MEKRKTTALREELRSQKLEEIKNTEPPWMTGIRIPYKGETKVYNAYKIPLCYLVYNPYNGRIGTKVKTFEVNSRKLNPEKEEDIKIIEDFLWESNRERNSRTLKSILKENQQEYGIVSRNGFIIDGNRRASILNRIIKEREKYEGKYNIDHCEYFVAVILEDDANEKEILKLETTYQMGKDEKLDYNATEKYLKCKQLISVGYSITQIAGMMRENENTIKKNLEVLEMMEKYLDYFGYNEMYSMLDKREDQFINLSTYEKAYKNKSGNAKTNWNPKEEDISDMVLLSFDYIRTKYEGKEFRNIAQNAKGSSPKSIFAIEKVWKNFKDKHFKAVESIKEEPIESFIKKNDIEGEVVTTLAERDEEWTGQVIDKLKENLNHSVDKLMNIQKADRPYELLEKALASLNEIDERQQSLYTKEALDLVKEINTSVYDLKKVIEKAMKNNE